MLESLFLKPLSLLLGHSYDHFRQLDFNSFNFILRVHIIILVKIDCLRVGRHALRVILRIGVVSVSLIGTNLIL